MAAQEPVHVPCEAERGTGVAQVAGRQGEVGRFHPADGRPLSPYEREILEILQEECAEVIVAASKILRFGLANTNPTTKVVNTTELGLEIGDLQYMISLVEGHHVVDRTVVEAGMLRKQRRLAIYLQSEPPAKAGK